MDAAQSVAPAMSVVPGGTMAMAPTTQRAPRLVFRSEICPHSYLMGESLGFFLVLYGGKAEEERGTTRVAQRKRPMQREKSPMEIKSGSSTGRARGLKLIFDISQPRPIFAPRQRRSWT